jgi:putative DNA methylase
MTQHTDKRLIEEYIPIKAISAEASRKSNKGNINTLHQWWARRPLVASRAAVFAALVPANAQPQLIDPDTNEPYTITKFMIQLCKWELRPAVLTEAQRLIAEAFPDGPPKVLDMFAGGGSIPLEALRLGAETYALDLNPVAHIIQLATLVYPQRYGAQLAEGVRQWGAWVYERVRAEIGDLYPLIRDSEVTPDRAAARVTTMRATPKQTRLFPSDLPEQIEMELLEYDDSELEEDEPDLRSDDVPFGYLRPVAYLWTHIVACPNPACRAQVPLVRQTWLRDKKNDNVALQMLPHPTENRMAFHVKHARSVEDFGFDPAGFSERGNSVCGRCGTTVMSAYVKAEGKAGRMGTQMMAVVTVRGDVSRRTPTKVYFSPDEYALPIPDDASIRARIALLTSETGISVPSEEVPEHLTGGTCKIYGFDEFQKLFTPRQLLTLLTFIKYIRQVYREVVYQSDSEYAKAVTTYITLAFNRLVTIMCTQARWRGDDGERVVAAFARQAIPMLWDYAEIMPFNTVFTSWQSLVEVGGEVIENVARIPNVAQVFRGSATELPNTIPILDGVITDPPYYDNISYADLSDFYYVWLKRALGEIYPEHLAADLTPKKKEAIAAPYRHENDVEARDFYEDMMRRAFREVHAKLRANGVMVTVYAHKTTAGWSTLIDSMRHAGFSITEAWPLDTEMRGRAIAQNTAALASSFFLVARKRDNGHTGYFITDVQPEMQRIVSERVRFFLMQGITGADLNIAAVGAGLAPYTRYATVELPNGEPMTAAAYLDEVQAEVVRVLLGEASRTDAATQYYIMARGYYGEAWVDFDEANTLARAMM